MDLVQTGTAVLYPSSLSFFTFLMHEQNFLAKIFSAAAFILRLDEGTDIP
jgi:hypothetical protein